MAITIIQALVTEIGDWTISIHPRHGKSEHNRKHVHVRKRGVKGEYSWNDDGTRHDKHRFPKSEQAIIRAKELAAEALKISSSVLHFLVETDGGVYIDVKIEKIAGEEGDGFRHYVRVGEDAYLFEGPNGLIILIEKINSKFSEI